MVEHYLTRDLTSNQGVFKGLGLQMNNYNKGFHHRLTQSRCQQETFKNVAFFHCAPIRDQQEPPSTVKRQAPAVATVIGVTAGASGS